MQINENKKDISGLKLAVYGDNNGRRGLVRRLDRVEINLRNIIWMNRTIILMLIGVIGKIIYDIVVM